MRWPRRGRRWRRGSSWAEGAALSQAHRALADLKLPGDEVVGTQVVRRALAEPLRWIALNAGFEADDVVQVVDDLPLGHRFNALTSQYGDMFNEAVIDPLKVTRAALKSAASIAALLITSETAVVEQVVGHTGAIIAPGFGDLA